MAATSESLLSRAAGFRSSSLRRGMHLNSRGNALWVDPDGSVRALESRKEKRALFGLEQLWFYKVQAGVVVPAQRTDWNVRLSPWQVKLTGRVFDSDVSQTIEFFPGESQGFVRRLSVRSIPQARLRLRVVELADPTAAHFGSSDRWGALGVNAFNRESHVAMDEVSDPPSARVVGSFPAPARFYMTTGRARAQDLLASGEVPEATAGMSGQVIIAACHDMDLSPSESREVRFVSIYNPGKLEDALSDFGRLQSGGETGSNPSPYVGCSDQSVADAAAWAIPTTLAGARSPDLLERYEVLRALGWVSPGLASDVVNEAKALVRRDGTLPHALDNTEPGVLETAIFLGSAAAQLFRSQDKKLVRSSYSLLKKLAGGLMASSKGASVPSDPRLPQGWRRRLGRGYPTGELPELALAVAAALEAASGVARLLSKSDDAGRFLERSKLIAEHVRRKLLDDRGFLSLCMDSGGRLRTDETADMAVAAYRHAFMASAEQAAAHRLLEKDFDTPYGPRSVPSSNLVYFNGTYGDGQLGGVWTRATLAHAVLCYRAGLGGAGSLALSKVARLVTDDALKLGGAPGDFPYWVDVGGREIRDTGSDPVAAARFLESILFGELGLPAGADRLSLAPPGSSAVGWLLLSDFWGGDQSTVFLGRGSGEARLFFSGSKLDSKTGTKFAKSERVEVAQRGLCGVSLHTPGQVVCVGSSSPTPLKATVSFSPRAAELSKRLSTPVEELDPSRGTWTKRGSIRVSTRMSFEAYLEPNGWKAYRVSTP